MGLHAAQSPAQYSGKKPGENATHIDKAVGAGIATLVPALPGTFSTVFGLGMSFLGLVSAGLDARENGWNLCNAGEAATSLFGAAAGVATLHGGFGGFGGGKPPLGLVGVGGFGTTGSGGISLAGAGVVNPAISGVTAIAGATTVVATTTGGGGGGEEEDNPDGNGKPRIPEPGEYEGYPDRQKGEPPNGMMGIYEYQDQTNGGKWYVGSASGSSHLRKRLMTHLLPDDPHRLSSLDDATWTVFPPGTSKEKLLIAERIRIEQVAKMVGRENMGNSPSSNPIHLSRVKSFFEQGRDKKTPGWPGWLYLPE